ncbi:hypothetical protein CMUS01_03316 [Colletotrichum musicola]|uniref:Uncharacterized protein n=1 Tax=Colletotrichum musicola TaxID=2175873 RepID=A0A8H6NTF3_9PEZI|nr:hypothetical protein CMUS01_03316 [Colletotrichum musicola]
MGGRLTGGKANQSALQAMASLVLGPLTIRRPRDPVRLLLRCEDRNLGLALTWKGGPHRGQDDSVTVRIVSETKKPQTTARSEYPHETGESFILSYDPSLGPCHVMGQAPPRPSHSQHGISVESSSIGCSAAQTQTQTQMHSLSAARRPRSLELCTAGRLAASTTAGAKIRHERVNLGGSNQDVCHLAHGQTNGVDYFVAITERRAGLARGLPAVVRRRDFYAARASNARSWRQLAGLAWTSRHDEQKSSWAGGGPHPACRHSHGDILLCITLNGTAIKMMAIQTRRAQPHHDNGACLLCGPRTGSQIRLPAVVPPPPPPWIGGFAWTSSAQPPYDPGQRADGRAGGELKSSRWTRDVGVSRDLIRRKGLEGAQQSLNRHLSRFARANEPDESYRRSSAQRRRCLQTAVNPSSGNPGRAQIAASPTRAALRRSVGVCES